MSGAQTIALRPLTDAQTSALTTELLGSDPSMGGLAAQVVARAAGNPFFVEEIVRDLAERGVLHGQPGAYLLRGDVADVEVPATLQATIGARIDRLDLTAKRTLNAAAVIGSRFDTDLLTAHGRRRGRGSADRGGARRSGAVHPARRVCVSAPADPHGGLRVTAEIRSRRSCIGGWPPRSTARSGSADENAALIAEHLEAAGDLHAAFAWHMRAGTWSTNRDIAAAQTSWRRARQVADRLPDDDPDRPSMRIAPRTLLCASAFRVGGSGADTGFDELRELCTAAGDQRSLAIGMAGLVAAHFLMRTAARRLVLPPNTSDCSNRSAIPTLTIALSPAMVAKYETGEMAEVLRLAQRVIDLADGDPTTGNLIIGSPLAVAIAMRGAARWCLGIAGWKDDLHQAIAMARAVDPITLAGVMWFTYITAIAYGVLLPDATALRDTADALAMAEQSGDDFALDLARTARGITLVHQGGPEREAGFDLLAKVRERAVHERFALIALPIVDIHIAREKARLGDLDGAIELARAVVDDLFDSGGSIWSALATTVLVEALLQRGGDGDLADARAAIDRLAAVPTDPGFVLHEICAAAAAGAAGPCPRRRGRGYREFRDRYRDDGDIAWLRGAHGDGRGDDMTAAGVACGTCGTELRDGDKFCHECGAPIIASHKPAEYKQVTVLFADVVHSMEIAAAVGAERLREIMTELVDRATAVVQRYGGTVDKFTGDGIMALFGAPVALEDHAFRACLAALDIQKEADTAGRRGRTPRRYRPATAGRAELGPGDRRRNRLQHCKLHSYWRTGWRGPTHGIDCTARRGDAQRVDGPTGGEHRCAG